MFHTSVLFFFIDNITIITTIFGNHVFCFSHLQWVFHPREQNINIINTTTITNGKTVLDTELPILIF